MSQSDNDSGGYNGLKAFAFTVGVTVLIFTVLYLAKRYNPTFFASDTFSQNHLWYLRGPNDPSETNSLGEEPRMWDVWIVSWYPLCSHPESRSERLRLSEGEDEKYDASCPTNDEKSPRWAEFLVSPIQLLVCIGRSPITQPLSADEVSDVADPAVSPPKAKADNPAQSTRVQISTIILMPALPRPTSPPSTSSPNSTYDPAREYVLGTSYFPYTSCD